MLKNKIFRASLILSVLFLSSMFAMGQNVSGPTSVTVGQSYQYTFNNGILYPTVNWLPGSGTVLTKWSSGLTHTAIISWTTPPTGSISVMNSGYTTQLGSLGGIAIASPPVPNTTFTITQNCEATSILRNTNPGSQYDWYWQTDPNGTSTTLGFAQTINRTTSGNLYLRTRTKNTPYVWSSTSQSVGAITVVSSPPSPGAISGDALIAAGTTPAQIANQTSASGTFVYGWENSTNGTVWNLISGATSATYSPGILNSKTYYRRKATNVCGTALSNTVTIDVYAIPVITSTNSRVIMGPVTMDAGAGYSAYDWKNSLNASVGSSRYLVTSTPDTYTVTITATSGGISVNAPSAPFQLLSQFDGQNMNYIISNTILADGVTSEDEIENLDVNKRSQTIQYFDGLGRSIQSVNTQGSPDKSDIVQPLVYDAFGREHRKYLPIVPGATDGWHETITYDAITGNYTGVAANFYGNNPTAKIAQDTRPFSETIFESSPLNRPLKGYGPGQQWSPSGSNKFIEQQYLTNVHGPGASPTAEKVIAWQINSSQVPVRSSAVTGYIETGGYFSSAQLHINTTVDEHGNQVRQYSNKQGQVVLKKVQASTSGTSNLNSVDYWALTYYLYDDFGNLRYVFPPELSKKIHQGDATGDNPNPDDLTNWAFQYKYDGRNRMVEKQVPGAGAVYMVYDDRDRLVLTQDAIQRSNRWTFTKYDALNRPVLTGIYFNTSTLGNMQLAVNNYYANLTASQAWYETYTGSGVHGYNNFSFPQVTNQHDYLTVTYYDNYTFRSQWNGSYSYFDEDLSESVNGLEYNQPANENLSVVGQITGFKIKVLDGGITGGYTWLKSVNYYDEKYRMIQALSDNYKGGVDRVTNVYDFVGKVLKTKSTHTDLTWKDRIGTSLTGNKLVRTASGNNWTGSGAASVQQLAPGQDGWLEVTVSETNTNRMIGLADTNPDLNYTSIDYAFYLNSTSLKIYENGSLKSTVAGTLISGDVVRIERTGTVMKYYKNNALVYTSATASSTLLFVDVSINTTGSTLTNVRTSFNTTAHSIIRRFEYDHGGRLLKTWHELDGAQPEILLAMNEYNELGQLVDKKLHSTVASGADAKQSVDYRYNIRGWLTKVNESDLSINESGDPRDFFGMELAYESDLGTGNPTTNLQYNGNINAIKWSTNLGLDNHDESAYNFTYDALNRLQHANHRTNTGTWTAGNYNENNLTYDLNGNIQTLQRTGDDGVQIDNLTYNYGSGSTFSNKLLFVTDGTANATDKIKGFVDGSTTGNDYSYDLNGNMLTDKNKNITANITYNFLNLPEKVTRNNSSVTYIYDATGRKLSLVADYASAQKQTDYAGEYVYENDVLQFISHEEGRILLQETETVFAADGSNVTPFTASANFTNTAQTINGETYIKVTPNVGITLSKLGATPIGGNITVAAGERYIYRVKGFSNSSKVTNLYVKGNSSDIIWFGANLPTNSTAEMWVENSFTIPAGVTQITLGVLYSVAGPSVSTDYFYINEVELVKLTTTTPEYQYNLKDHLGNVRSTFTTQPKKDTLTATLEVSSASEEQAMFNPSYDNATIASTAVYNHTAGGTRSLRLSAANANEMVGPC
jgi:hypothetical protein